MSAFVENGYANLEVVNAGEPLTIDDRDESMDDEEPTRFGLSIVWWIADVHGGELRYTRENGANRFSVLWPALRSANLQATDRT